MAHLLRTRPVAVWVALVLATNLSWWLGSDLGAGSSRRATALIILGIAVVKIRLVGLDFMGLRQAPAALRTAFEAYVIVLLAVLTGMYIAA